MNRHYYGQPPFFRKRHLHFNFKEESEKNLNGTSAGVSLDNSPFSAPCNVHPDSSWKQMLISKHHPKKEGGETDA